MPNRLRCSHLLNPIICLLIALTVSNRAHTHESVSCKDTFSSSGSLTPHFQISGGLDGSSSTRISGYDSTLKETEVTGFTEINPWAARWSADKSGNARASLHADPASESVAISGYFQSPLAKTDWVRMNLDKIWDHLSVQTVGEGLEMKIKANQPGLRLEVRLTGHAMSGRPYTESLQSAPTEKTFSVIADIVTAGDEQRVLVKWEKFKFESDTGSSYHNEPKLLKSRHEFRRDALENSDVAYNRSEISYAKGDSFYPGAFTTTGIEFRIVDDKQPSPYFELDILGPIFRSLSMDWLLSHPVEVSAKNDFHDQGPRNQSTARSTYMPTELYLMNISRPQAQEYAFRIISLGDEAIREEVERYGGSINEIGDGKLSQVEFNRTLSAKGPFHANIPVESGEFANWHSRYAHVGQYLAAMYGNDANEIRDINHLATISGSGPGHWGNIWNIYFEAPGDGGPNAPHWWLKEFRRRGILNEPAVNSK